MDPETHEKPADKKTDLLLTAIRAELLCLIEGPDLGSKLPSVALVAAKAQELLLSLRVDPAAMRGGGPASGINVALNSVPMMSSGYGTMNVGPIANPVYSPPEQFGAQAIRQLVALLPDILAARQRDPVQLVEAIAVAREKGLTDLADKLQRQLLIAMPDAEAPHEHHEQHEEGIPADAAPPPVPALPAPAPPTAPSLTLNGAGVAS